MISNYESIERGFLPKCRRPIFDVRDSRMHHHRGDINNNNNNTGNTSSNSAIIGSPAREGTKRNSNNKNNTNNNNNNIDRVESSPPSVLSSNISGDQIRSPFNEAQTVFTFDQYCINRLFPAF